MEAITISNDLVKDTSFLAEKESLNTLLSEHKAGYAKKLYKAQSDAHKAAELQKDIETKTNFLCESGERKPVNFNDINDVRARTLEYLDACAQTSSFPSMMGLAAFGYGVSRNTLYAHLRNNKNPEVSQFIDRVRDLIADVLSSASLKRNADNVTTIFILKNGLGFSDRVEVEPITTQKSGADYTVEDIRKRYVVDEKEDA